MSRGACPDARWPSEIELRRVPVWKKLHRIAGRASHVEATVRREEPGRRLQSKTDDGSNPIRASGLMPDRKAGPAGVKSAGAYPFFMTAFSRVYSRSLLFRFAAVSIFSSARFFHFQAAFGF
jgi:hypothetical protein